MSDPRQKDFDERHTRIPVVSLTKREYFAAKAMQGILTACNNPEIGGPQYEEKTVAENALKMADELIKQLEDGRPR